MPPDICVLTLEKPRNVIGIGEKALLEFIVRKMFQSIPRDTTLVCDEFSSATSFFSYILISTNASSDRMFVLAR